MGIAQLGEAPRHEVERFVPGSRLELARLAILYERRADAVGRVDEIEACRASLHAQKPLVRRTGRRFGIPLASLAGVAVPASLVLNLGEDPQAAVDFARQTGYPLFVKPVKAGSSYGISQIHQEEELLPALDLAFQYDNQVILEETIPGFEVGCAVIGTRELLVGEIDEIELSGGFFDFTEKYTLKTSAIHVPARVDPQTAQAVKQTAKVLYLSLIHI